ncbi:hypothetical protein FRX51_00490 [Streptococcus sp. sy010]|nr:hypothetical protein FRX51_00490 [Streptococcus sp. sy010]
MIDHQLEASVKVLLDEYHRTVAMGETTFTVHNSFFEGLDRTAHLNAFLLQCPVRISHQNYETTTFEVR